MLNRKTIIGLLEELGKEYDLFMGICACVSVITDTAEEAKSNPNLPHLKLMSQAVKDGAKMLEEDAKFEWISVKDRLPNDDATYLACGCDGYLLADYARDGEWESFDLTDVTRYVSYWMPLPKEPEEHAGVEGNT